MRFLFVKAYYRNNTLANVDCLMFDSVHDNKSSTSSVNVKPKHLWLFNNGNCVVSRIYETDTKFSIQRASSQGYVLTT